MTSFNERNTLLIAFWVL